MVEIILIILATFSPTFITHIVRHNSVGKTTHILSLSHVNILNVNIQFGGNVSISAFLNSSLTFTKTFIVRTIQRVYDATKLQNDA